MTLAGGIMGALLHRERTGEATEVDVSLLGVGLWSLGAAMALSLQLGVPWGAPAADSPTGNPLVGIYPTSDGRALSFSCLQAHRYWADAWRCFGRPELGDDDRFATPEALAANVEEATRLVRSTLASRPAAEWVERLQDFSGQWTPVQDTLEAAADPQSVANGYIQDCTTADGIPFQLVAAPIQYGGAPAQPGRAPEFNEHGDAILGELGLDWDAIVDLKVRGVVA